MTPPGRTSTRTRWPPAATLAACLLVLLGVLAPASASQAQASDPASTASAGAPAPAPAPPTFSLTVSPTRLVVAPDDMDADQTVEVTNGGSTPVELDVAKRNFTGRIDGTLAFQEDAPYAASTWISLDRSSLVVAPGATETITATISAPDDPEPGDHQVALVFLVPAGRSSDNIRINRGIAIPVYVTVPGPIDESATISGLDAGGFSTGGAVDVTATVRNTGTVHRDFRGDDRLELSADGDRSDFDDFTVARGSRREITTSWKPPLICICHPTVAIANADGTTSSRSVRVVVLPLPLLGGALVALVALALGARVLRRRYRSQVAQAAAALAQPAGADGG